MLAQALPPICLSAAGGANLDHPATVCARPPSAGVRAGGRACGAAPRTCSSLGRHQHRQAPDGLLLCQSNWAWSTVKGSRAGWSAGGRAGGHQAPDQLRGRLAGGAAGPRAPADAVQGHRQPMGSHAACAAGRLARWLLVQSSKQPVPGRSVKSGLGGAGAQQPLCTAWPSLFTHAARRWGDSRDRPHPPLQGGLLAIGCAQLEGCGCCTGPRQVLT